MRKKGILIGEHVINIIIAVLAVVVLAYLGIQLYNSYLGGKTELKQAQATLDMIVGVVEEIKPGEEITKIITSPRDWYLLDFKKRENSPDTCFGEACLCLCETLDINDCKKNGACKGIEEDVVVGSENLAYTDSNLFYIKFDKPQNLLLFNKEKEVFINTQDSRFFENMLDFEINFEGESKKIISAVLASVDNYLDIKSSAEDSLLELSKKEGYGLTSIGEFYRTRREYLVNLGFDADELIELDAKNEALFEELREKLDGFCSRYFIKVPQGLISEKYLMQERAEGGEVFFKNYQEEVGWTDPLVYKIEYSGELIEIKFRMLESCRK